MASGQQMCAFGYTAKLTGSSRQVQGQVASCMQSLASAKLCWRAGSTSTCCKHSASASFALAVCGGGKQADSKTADGARPQLCCQCSVAGCCRKSMYTHANQLPGILRLGRFVKILRC